MSAAKTLARATAVGVTIEAVDGRLRWAGRAPRALLAEMAAHKADLIELLAAPQPEPDDAAFEAQQALFLARATELTEAGLDRDGAELQALREVLGIDPKPEPVAQPSAWIDRADVQTVVADLRARGWYSRRIAAHLGLSKAEVDNILRATRSHWQGAKGMQPKSTITTIFAFLPASRKSA